MFIPRTLPQAFVLTNPSYSFRPCTILLSFTTSKLFFQAVFQWISPVLWGRPTERFPIHCLSHIPAYSNPTIPHTFNMARHLSVISPIPFATPHNSLIHVFATLSILLISHKTIWYPTCTSLIIDLSFSLHTIVSITYNRTDTSNAWKPHAASLQIQLQTPTHSPKIL